MIGHAKHAWLLVLAALALGRCLAAETPPMIQAGNRPFIYGFGTWEKAPKAFAVEPGGIHIVATSGQGGAGISGLQVDLTAHNDWTPLLTATLGAGNKSAMLQLHLSDADGSSHSFHFDLTKLQPGVAGQVAAEYGATLAEPWKVEKVGTTPGLGPITNVLVVGDWTANPVDLLLGSLTLTPPTDALRADQAKLRQLHADEAEKERREAAAKEQARTNLLTRGAQHPADGPALVTVCATGPDLLTFVLQSGRHANNQVVPYAAQPGDELVEEDRDKPRHLLRDGHVVDYFQTAVYRTENNHRNRLGLISPDHQQVFIEHSTTGQLLDETVVDWPAGYRIQSPDDPAFATPTQPAAVYRKGKPDGFSHPLAFAYTITLRLPAPLKEGATYAVRCLGVNTAQETVTYVHRPRQAQSLAIHAIQTGYRPDDPYKRAYVSFWPGVDKDGQPGGGTPTVDRFELLDSEGRSVFSGKAELAKAAGAEEQISVQEKFDYTKVAVYRLDFGAFKTPGSYRVFVPGLGVSGAFRLAADVWNQPFRAAMQGILSQRQAIDLGPPSSAFTRKRTFHPDDGVQFYQLDIPIQAGEEGVRGARMLELAKAGPLQRVTITPGGYQDAGDWDTLAHHLSATYKLLGLYDLNPTAFAATHLTLPGTESTNRLPDLLDEALWQMPMWRSLQLPDGGVRGGYGDGWGCYPGETSSMLKYAGVYAADPDTSLRYAASAARAARVLRPFDRAEADKYLDSAKRAWAYAELHGKPDDPVYQKTLGFDKDLANQMGMHRIMAAVELLAVTRDPVYDQAFRKITDLARPAGRYNYDLEPDYSYARLPEGVGDPALKKAAVERIAAYADYAIEFSHKNAFDLIGGERTDLPMLFYGRWFSTPGQGGFALIYAHALTHNPKYLAAIVQSSNYCLGANPDNLSYCCGVGANAEHFPFFVDAQVTGQYPDVPVGHIPFGQGNEGSTASRGFNGWVQTWLLNFGPTRKMIPNWYDWPVTEQYVDFGRYPLHNETCFDASTLLAGVCWFYLDAR